MVIIIGIKYLILCYTYNIMKKSNYQLIPTLYIVDILESYIKY